MSNVANASSDAVHNIKTENSEMEYAFNELRGAARNAVSQLKSECESKLKAYTDMVSEAKELIKKARNAEESDSKAGKVSQAESMCAYLTSQCDQIQQIMSTLNGLDRDLVMKIDRTLSMVKNADGCLQAVLKAIGEYTSFGSKY